MMYQAPQSNPPSTRRYGLVIVGIIVVCLIAVLWVMSNLGLAPNFWINIVVPILTGAGLVIALLQLCISNPSSLSNANHPIYPSNHQQKRFLSISDLLFTLDVDEGMIAVKAKKYQLALNISMSSGFGNLGNQSHNKATCVMKRGLFVYTYYIVIFSPLKSGDYTIHSQFTGHVAMVKVFPGRSSVIDWR